MCEYDIMLWRECFALFNYTKNGSGGMMTPHIIFNKGHRGKYATSKGPGTLRGIRRQLGERYYSIGGNFITTKRNYCEKFRWKDQI